MKALIFDKEKGLDLRDAPEPRVVRDDDVLMKVSATGICGTDLHILGGAYPAKAGIILGHETAGVVLEVGRRVTRFKEGDRVILDPTFHCGMCHYCQTNRPNYCTAKAYTETGVSHDGTFAERHVAREAFLHELPGELSFEEGSLTEPLACCLNALTHTRMRQDSRVLVVGAGPIGLLFGVAVHSMGAEVAIGDIESYRIEQAGSLLPQVHDLRDDGLGRLASGPRFDLVIDTSGRALDKILPIVERGGEVVLAGLDYGYEVAIRPSFLTDNGIRLIGSIDTNRTFSTAISMLRRVPALRKVITHRFPLAGFADAFGTLGLDLRTRERKNVRANKVILVP